MEENHDPNYKLKVRQDSEHIQSDFQAFAISATSFTEQIFAKDQVG